MESRTSDDRLDQIMERIREEIASRKGLEPQQPQPTDPPQTTPSRKPPPPPLLPEPLRLPRRNGTSALPVGDADTFHVNDFLGFADAEFLTQAFHGVLRRAPRPDEFAQYMTALGTTDLTHLETLGRLRYSEEGERIGVRLAGLWPRYQLHRFYRSFPVLSYLVKWLLDAARLPFRLDALRVDDSRLRNRLGDLDELSSAVENTINDVIPRIESRFHELEDFFHRIEDRLLGIEWRLDSIESEKADTESVDFIYTQILEVHNFSQRLAKLQNKVTEIANTSVRSQQYDEIQSELLALQEALAAHKLEHRQPIDGIRSRIAELEATVAAHNLEKHEHQLDETRSQVAALQETLAAHNLGEHHKQLDETRSQLAALQETLAAHHLEKHEHQLDETRSQLAALQETPHVLGQLAGRVGGCEEQINLWQNKFQEIQPQVADIGIQVLDHKRNILDQQRRLALLLEEVRKRLPKPIEADQVERMVTEGDHLLDAQYVSFEDRYRGTREDIKRRQSIYIPYIEATKLDSKKYPVLDLGCGRGEWLELLAETGIKAKGVDINTVMLQQCRDLELDVQEGDCLEFLKGQRDETFGVLTSFHLIEHLAHGILIGLLDEAIRVLRPGGLLILETPNPANLIVGSCNFYMDPTHRNPIPSPLLGFLVEARGFCNAEILHLHPFDKSYRLNGSEVAERISDLLYGPQDYAVIGHKA